MKRKILLTFLGLMLVIQLIRPDFTNPATKPEEDFFNIYQPSAEVAGLMKTSCADCHSNQLNKPWYAEIAPVSWLVKNHINEGRREVNFSEWGKYSLKRKKHKMHECIEMLEEDEMAPGYYKLTHSNAKLDESQRKLLINYFRSIETQLASGSGE